MLKIIHIKKYYPGLRERLEAGRLAKKQKVEKEEAEAEALKNAQPSTSNQPKFQVPLKIEEKIEKLDKSAIEEEPKAEENVVAKKRPAPSKVLEKTDKADTKKKLTSLENTEIETKTTRNSKRLRKN